VPPGVAEEALDRDARAALTTCAVDRPARECIERRANDGLITPV
jgi:hypothetical protein